MSWFIFLACFVSTAFANYGQVPVEVPPAPNNPPANPGPYQPQPPVVQYPGWYPGYHNSRSNSRSRSDSRSDSREDESCRKCNKLKQYRNDTLVGEFEQKFPSISYYTEKGDCRKAILSCPFDFAAWQMVVPSKNSVAILTHSTLAQRVVTCNKNGKYQAKGMHLVNVFGNEIKEMTIQFSKVVCIKM